MQILTASFAFVLVAFVFGDRLGAWEAVALLPLSAVLAGRLLADWLTKARLIPALAAVLACYGMSLAHDATRPPPFSPNQRAANWLARASPALRSRLVLGGEQCHPGQRGLRAGPAGPHLARQAAAHALERGGVLV